MKQLEVQIMGQSYLLGCPDGGDSRLLEAVERVDTAMCKIRDGGKVRARDRIAVIPALAHGGVHAVDGFQQAGVSAIGATQRTPEACSLMRQMTSRRPTTTCCSLHCWNAWMLPWARMAG